MNQPQPSDSTRFTKFVMCIRNRGYPADLTLFRVYRARTSEALAQRGVLSVIDDSGESYLFDADAFVPVDLPPESARAFDALTAQLNRAWAEQLAALGPEEEDMTMLASPEPDSVASDSTVGL